MTTDLEQLLAELKAEFLDELPGRCNDLEDAVLALESQQDGAFDELYRQVHSLKGSGGGVGLQIITTICHQFESFLSDARNRFDRRATSTALAYIDLLRKPVQESGRESAGIALIEQTLDQMREASLSGRSTILVVEPANAIRSVYLKELTDSSTRVQALKTGMEALACMLQEPFDLLIISRELSDLNALAVVAALRESRSRNNLIPVIMISSNAAPVPEYLAVRAVVKRDVHLISNLIRLKGEILSPPSGKASRKG